MSTEYFRAFIASCFGYVRSIQPLRWDVGHREYSALKEEEMEAQEEYDSSIELQELLTKASESKTIKRRRK